MRRKILLMVIYFFLNSLGQLYAQNKIWCFGDHVGLNFNHPGTPPFPDTFYTAMESSEAAAAVSDPDGNLLFYTDGSYVWNRIHDTMPNGNPIITAANNFGITATSSCAQGALIVPVPEAPGRYYIFSLTESEEPAGNAGKLHYSIVDMSLDGGWGDVMPGKKGILLASVLSEHMIAIEGDHCNVWLLAHAKNNGDFKVWEITASGISATPVVSSLNNVSGISYLIGVMKSAPNRRKIALTTYPNGSYGSLQLCDFDPATGKVSNQMLLDRNPPYYGVCFSPDNSKLYAATVTASKKADSLFQFNLSTSNPANTKTFISLTGDGDLRLGPDDRIYKTNTNSEKNIGVINSPNMAGIACDYEVLFPLSDLPSGFELSFGLGNDVVQIHKDTILSVVHNIKPPCFSDATTTIHMRAYDTSGWGFVWNNGNLGSGITVDSPGTYWVSYYIAPCSYQVDTFRLFFDSRLPQLHVHAGCKGAHNAVAWATPAPGDTITYALIWRDSNNRLLRGPIYSNKGDTLQNISSDMEYTLQVTAPNGCDTTLSIIVPAPNYQATFTASDTLICMGDIVSFQNSSFGLDICQWLFGDGDSSSLMSPQHTFIHAGNYLVQLIAQSAYPVCYDITYKTIVVDSMVQANFVTFPDSICIGQEAVTFYPQVDTNTLSGLHWNFGDGTEMISENENKIQHAYETAGSLPVRLTAHFRACPDTTFTDTVHIYPLPKVDLGPDTSLCLHDAPIILQNRQTLPAGIYHYQWNTGDTTESLKIVHPGIYRLTITAEPLGCNNTETIVVHKDCYIDIPNAFTPNGDGTNDFFFPRQLLSQKVTRFKMQIFNRWGELIFETTKINGRGWDGTYTGKDQPEGVYVYLIDAAINGVQEEHYQGNVTLIR